MTDEEKKAIECVKYEIIPELETILEDYNEPSDWAYYTKIVLKLIEKQQKEIEKYKRLAEINLNNEEEFRNKCLYRWNL